MPSRSDPVGNLTSHSHHSSQDTQYDHQNKPRASKAALQKIRKLLNGVRTPQKHALRENPIHSQGHTRETNTKPNQRDVKPTHTSEHKNPSIQETQGIDHETENENPKLKITLPTHTTQDNLGLSTDSP